MLNFKYVWGIQMGITSGEKKGRNRFDVAIFENEDQADEKNKNAWHLLYAQIKLVNLNFQLHELD